MNNQRNAHLHPVFAGIVNSFASANDDLNDIKVRAYVKALKAHDWEYEHSDDQHVWKVGREQRAQLRLAQREIDPNGAVWNLYAPAEHQIRPALAAA